MGYLDRLRRLFSGASGAGPVAVRPPPDPRTAWLTLIDQVKVRLNAGDYPGGVQRAYLGALDDLQRTYGIVVPPGRTNAEILEANLSGRPAQAVEVLRRLYDVYRPLRYGPPGRKYEREPIVELLRDLYGNFALWELEKSLWTGGSPGDEGDASPSSPDAPASGGA
jgi:hypothetical protein